MVSSRLLTKSATLMVSKGGDAKVLGKVTNVRVTVPMAASEIAHLVVMRGIGQDASFIRFCQMLNKRRPPTWLFKHPH